MSLSQRIALDMVAIIVKVHSEAAAKPLPILL